jgi:NAD(P)-dependent dehydrogenase (short-subunit alcohol dehydrogenase family)
MAAARARGGQHRRAARLCCAAAGLLLVAWSLPPMEPEPASSTFDALITGGNRGIGLQVARDLLAHMTASGRRCTVFLGCRDLSAGRELASQLLVADAASGGCTVEAVRVDITCAGSICDAVSFVEARTEQLHLLVNNAGIMPEAEAAGPAFSADAARATTQTNFEGTVGVTEAFLPLLLRAPSGSASVLSTSSGVGARTLGLVSEQHRQQLLAEDLDLAALRGCVNGILHALQADESHPYHNIPTVGYGVSKMAVNCYTQLLARRYPTLRVNACSPGFTNTDMCKHYTGSRVPKEVALGASVFLKAIFGDLGASQTGKFFKEASKAGTPLAEANAVIDKWVQ